MARLKALAGGGRSDISQKQGFYASPRSPIINQNNYTIDY